MDVTEEILIELGFTKCGRIGELEYVYDYRSHNEESPRLLYNANGNLSFVDKNTYRLYEAPIKLQILMNIIVDT